MAGSSLPAWESIEEPRSSDEDEGSPEVEEELPLLSSLKRKGYSRPVARASPKRQRTAEDGIAEPGPSSNPIKLPRASWGTNPSADVRKSVINRPRASKPGSLRHPKPNVIVGPSKGKPSTSAIPSSSQRPRSSPSSKLPKPIGQLRGNERQSTGDVKLPITRSRSSSGPTKLPSKGQPEVIEISDSSDDGHPLPKPVAKTTNMGLSSAIRIGALKPRPTPTRLPKRTPVPTQSDAEPIMIYDSDDEPPASKTPKAVMKTKYAESKLAQASASSPVLSHQPASQHMAPSASSSATHLSKPSSLVAPVSKSTLFSTIASARNTSERDNLLSPRLVATKTSATHSEVLRPRVPKSARKSAQSTKQFLDRSSSRADSSDDPDKMDVDNRPSISRRLSGTHRSFKGSEEASISAVISRSTKTSVQSVTAAGESTKTSAIPKPVGKLPLPGRSSLTGTSETRPSKTLVDDVLEPRPPILPAKGGSTSSGQAKPSTHRKGSSGLDLNGLKDVLNDAVSISSSQATRPLKLPQPGKPSPRLSSSTSAKKEPRLTQTGGSISSTPMTGTSSSSSHADLEKSKPLNPSSVATFTVQSKSGPAAEEAQEIIDLTLDSPPPLLPPRLLSAQKKADTDAQSSEVIATLPIKTEVAVSMSVLEPKTLKSTDVSGPHKTIISPPLVPASQRSTPSRPMPLPLPTPRPPVAPMTPQEPEAVIPTYASPALGEVKSISPLPLPSPDLNSSKRSNIDNDAFASEEGSGRQSSGSESSSTWLSSSNKAPAPTVCLPHRTARKSTRGRPRNKSSAPESHYAIPPSTSAASSEAGSSLPPSSSRPPAHSPTPSSSLLLPHRTARKSTQGAPSNKGFPIRRSSAPESHHAMPPSTSAASSEAGLSLPSSSSQPLAHSPIPSSDGYRNPPTSGLFEPKTLTDLLPLTAQINHSIIQNPIPADQIEASMTPTDNDSELEYVDVPLVPEPLIPGPPRHEPSIETDSAEMMDVEDLLTASGRESPLQLPEEEIEATPDPMDVIEPDDDLQRPRRSTRSSRSTSNELIQYFSDEFSVDSGSSPPTSPTPPEDPSISAPIRVFGGFQSMSWRTYRQNPNNFQPKCYFGKDLPHALQDTINSFSDAGRRHRSLASIMEATIRENTADDEPDAPLIEIINEVDDDPTPPWEFHYSNKMWLGEDVPLPDVENLVHCNCIGRCDPKSKTCACVQRQQAWDPLDPTLGFLYDGKGHIKSTEYPVFECNDRCGCSDDCRNRVVQHGRKCAVRIQKTVDKGWGVFAGAKKIPFGTFIGIYAGELLTDRVGEIRGITYNKFGRTYLFDLDFWHLREGNEDWDIQYTVDAYHAGNFTRFLNHSCDPNCGLVSCYINDADLQKPLLTVFARRDIEPFEELCFSYFGDPEDVKPSSSSVADQNTSTEDKLEEVAAGDKDDAPVYGKCYCKAANCTGFMFKSPTFT